MPAPPPRTFTAQPDLFGKAADITWPPAASGQEVQRLAAQLQHDLCVRFTDALRVSKNLGRLTGYAHAIAEAGADEDDIKKAYARLGRVLRGETPMRLDDVAQAKVHFGSLLDLTGVFDKR